MPSYWEAAKRRIASNAPSALLGCFRSFNLWRHLRAYEAREVNHSCGEFALVIHLADRLGEGWYDRESAVPPEVSFLRRYGLREGALCFDLGAHQCVMAVLFAKIVGDSGHVVAVEANDHNVSVGRINRKLNSCWNLEIIHAAVSDRAGYVFFNRGLNGQMDDGTGAWGRSKVESLTVDGLTSRYGRPDVLFMDVEGSEVAALDGAGMTLQMAPDCFVEVHVGVGLERFGGSVERLMEFFPTSRYDLYMLSDAEPEVKAFDASVPLVRSRFFLVAIAKRSNVEDEVPRA